MYNGKFNQNLEVLISCNNHRDCLELSKIIKKQCDAWLFNVKYTENKSARKGSVLQRGIQIQQTAYAGDILIFKEAIRRVCSNLDPLNKQIQFIDKGTEPQNDLKEINL